MTDKQPPFNLPKSLSADHYGDHWSFCYASDGVQRGDYDFRLEFTEGVPEPEQVAIVSLLEAAPNLLRELQKRLAAEEKEASEAGVIETPWLDSPRAAIADAISTAPYIVEHLIGSDWENIWTTYDGEHDQVGHPSTYASFAEALDALREYFRD